MMLLKSVCIVYDMEMTQFHVCRLADHSEMIVFLDKMKINNTKFYPGQQADDFIDDLIENGLVCSDK